MITFPNSKTCGGCGKTKPLTEFNRVKHDPRFFKNLCKECEAVGAAKFKNVVRPLCVDFNRTTSEVEMETRDV